MTQANPDGAGTLQSSTNDLSLEQLEAHYCQSSFVKEMCVLRLAEPGSPAPARLFGVVVADMDVLRKKRIVNAGDIIRFEMEGLAADLTASNRVHAYCISFEQLPRTTTNEIDRQEVERNVRHRLRAASSDEDAPVEPADRAWMETAPASLVVGIARRRLRKPARLLPDSNLELDLGFDSLERIELLTEIEQQLGVRITSDAAAQIFTVRQLVSACSSIETTAFSSRQESDACRPSELWATILREGALKANPELSVLLRRRRLAKPMMWMLGRLVRPFIARIQVSGLQNLPTNGGYIICPNHQSYLDPFLMCSVLPMNTFTRVFSMGAVEHFETPLTRSLARIANLIALDPDSNLVPAMQAGALGLLQDRVLLLFPEGERSIDGTVKKFKKGGPILAQHLGVPIVPVAIKGAYEVWQRGRGFNWRMAWPWSGHCIKITIGKPLWFARDADYNETASQLRDSVARMWQSL